MMNRNKEFCYIKADNIQVSKNRLSEIEEYIRTHNYFSRFPLNTSFYELVQQLPQLAELASTIREALENECRFVIVENYPVNHERLAICKFLFLSLISSIGIPTPTDKVDREIVWKVTARTNLQDGYTPTITEHNRAAALHTDSSYLDMPEKYVALFVVRPASDGGISTVFDGRDLISMLKTNGKGKKCLELLSSFCYPFRVPTAFTNNHDEQSPEWVCYPIISDSPLIRYRNDLIIAGLNNQPPRDLKAARWALGYLHKTLNRCYKYKFRLKSGDILIVNNHEILHGRTAFKDNDRLLLRIRAT